jgi:hypothetical protein
MRYLVCLEENLDVTADDHGNNLPYPNQIRSNLNILHNDKIKPYSGINTPSTIHLPAKPHIGVQVIRVIFLPSLNFNTQTFLGEVL